MKDAKILVVAAFLASMTAACFALSLVELKSGEKLSTPFSYEKGVLQIEGKGAIPATGVQQILFGEGTGSSTRSDLQKGDASKALAIASAAVRFIQAYPDAGGIVLGDEIRWVLHENGGHSMHCYFLGLVKKEDHKGWADQGMAFTEGRDRVHVTLARSIRPDGTIINADPAEFKISKPQVSPGMFVKFMQISFRVPGVEVGSLVEVEWELETYNPYRSDFFFPLNYFQGSDPVFYSRMTVEIPAEKKLFWETRNFPEAKEKPVETSEGKVHRYQWERNDMRPIVEEPLMPRGGDAREYVQASLFEGWDPVIDWINGYWKTNTTPSPELASKTMELIKGAATEDERVAKILHWIERNIRYIIIKGDAATVYGSWPAHETVQKQFGCCVDKAMVLSAMLNAAGIKNGPLLINAGGHDMSKRIPNLNISHSISRVTRADGKKYYLDSTGYDFRYPSLPTMDQGRMCLDPFDRTVDYIPMQTPEENMFRSVATMTLAADGRVEVRMQRTFCGEMEVGLRSFMKSLKPTEREEFLTKRFNSFGRGVKLLDMKLENLENLDKPFTQSYAYSLESYPRKTADLAVFKIPGFLESLRFEEAGLATRVFPIEYDSTEGRTEEGVFNIPSGWKIRSLPAAVNIDTPFFQFIGGYEPLSETAFKYKAVFRRLAKKISLQEYPRFKEELNRIERFGRERIFLTQKVAGGQP